MRRILACTGILGGGTALVFALAAVTAMVFPQGPLVAGGWNGGFGTRDRLVGPAGFQVGGNVGTGLPLVAPGPLFDPANSVSP